MLREANYWDAGSGRGALRRGQWLADEIKGTITKSRRGTGRKVTVKVDDKETTYGRRRRRQRLPAAQEIPGNAFKTLAAARGQGRRQRGYKGRLGHDRQDTKKVDRNRAAKPAKAPPTPQQ